MLTYLKKWYKKMVWILKNDKKPLGFKVAMSMQNMGLNLSRENFNFGFVKLNKT